MRRLEANGTTIAYARTGAGPPIVLMHGAEAAHSMFAPLAARLEKRLTVMAYDQGDSGDTRNPRPYLGPTPLQDLSRITAPALVLAGREDRLVPCAHSLSIAKEIPGASILEGVGHVNAIQAPAKGSPGDLWFLASGMKSVN